MRLDTILLAVTLAGCGDSTPCSGFFGDPDRPVELEMVVLDGNGKITPIEDGARVPLVQPPQGGKVIFAGLRARNLDTCGIAVIGSLRDGTAATDRIVALDGRPIDLKGGDDGWAHAAEPGQLSAYSNLPACPNYTSSRDIFEEEYPLTLSVRDRGDRRAQETVLVVPFCSEPKYQADCLCKCKQGYRDTRVCEP